MAQAQANTNQALGVGQNADGTIFGYNFQGLISEKFRPNYSKGGGSIWTYSPGPSLLQAGIATGSTCAANFYFGAGAVSLNNPGVPFTIYIYYTPDYKSLLTKTKIASDTIPANLIVPNGVAAYGTGWSSFDACYFSGPTFQVQSGLGAGATATAGM